MQKPLYITLLLSLLFFSAQAQKKSYRSQQGDRAFDMFDYQLAADHYLLAVKHHKADSNYAMRKAGDCFRLLNEPAKAKQWYGRVVDATAVDPIVKFYYADAARQFEDYPTAKKYYEQYQKLIGDNRNVSDILLGLENLPEIAKKNPAYTIQLMPFNSGFSDMGAAFYNKDSIFYTSNRPHLYSGENDRWARHSFYNIYKAPAANTGGAAKLIKKKPNGKFHDGPLVYNPATYLMIFTRSNQKRCLKTAADKKTVFLKLYSMVYPSTKKPKVFSLPFNDDNYSNAHPTLSKDGKTIYFASDRPGGFGGTDIYKSERSGDAWTASVNLGPEINSRYDEKFPFLTDDGTLYFASNALGGLGGLDIYESKQEEKKWMKPANVGAPINSSFDDFGYIYKSETGTGFFTSNRKGGAGDDDVYSFAKKLNAEKPITIRVLDEETKEPIEGANVSLPCAFSKISNFNTNSSGEVEIAIGTGSSCVAEATASGYNTNTLNIDYKDRTTKYTLLMKKPSNRKLLVLVKEKESGKPVRDFNLAINDKAGVKGQRMFQTNATGELQLAIQSIDYLITSPDDAAINDNLLATETVNEAGFIKRVYVIDPDLRKVNVPVISDCFDPESKVILTNLTDKIVTMAQVEADGKLRLSLTPNCKYSLEYDGRKEDFETNNLKPGQTINLKCKFIVGETWILQDIYYDLNKANIRPDAAKELTHLANLMKRNASLEIELSSHTDCRQTMSYNQNLSVRRAKSAVEYILSKGVKSMRLVAAGYGESKLVNGCACEPTNESVCSDEQHQMNRRTEVKVLKY